MELHHGGERRRGHVKAAVAADHQRPARGAEGRTDRGGDRMPDRGPHGAAEKSVAPLHRQIAGGKDAEEGVGDDKQHVVEDGGMRSNTCR